MSSRGDLDCKMPPADYACSFDIRPSFRASCFKLELTDDPYFVPAGPKIVQTTTGPLSQAAKDAERVELERWEKINHAKTNMVKAAAKLAIACGSSLFGIMTLNASIDFQWLGFLGNYGSEVDLVIKRIYKAIVPEQHLVKIYSDQDIAEILHSQGCQTITSAEIQAYRASARERDLTKGPTWNDVAYTSSDAPKTGEEKDSDTAPVTYNLIDDLRALGVSEENLTKLTTFLNDFGHNPVGLIRTSSKPGAKDGVNFGGKIELSLMNISKAHLMPALHITEQQLVEGQGSAGPKKALTTFLFGPEVQAAMTDPNCAARFDPKKLKKALREEIDVGVLKRKDGTPARPEDLNFFFEHPHMIRVWFGFLHCAAIDATCRVMPMSERNAATRRLLADIGTRAQLTERITDGLYDGGITGLVGTQECSPEMAASLRARGFATTTQDLGESEIIGTSSFYDTRRFTFVERIPHDYRDSDGRDWKLQTAALQLRAIESFMVFFANLHGDAAKPGDKKKLDGIVKYEEAVKQHRNTQSLIRYSAKHIAFACTGDFNIKSDEELQALTDSVAAAGHMIIVVGPTTGKVLIYSLQDLKVGMFRGGSGDLVIISKLFFQAIMSQVAGQNIQRDLLMPNKLENWIDHRSAGVIVMVNEASLPKKQHTSSSSSTSASALAAIEESHGEESTEERALLDETLGTAPLSWIDDLLEGETPEHLPPLVQPDQAAFANQGDPDAFFFERASEGSSFTYEVTPETPPVTVHTAQADALEEDPSVQEGVSRSAPIDIKRTAIPPKTIETDEMF